MKFKIIAWKQQSCLVQQIESSTAASIAMMYLPDEVIPATLEIRRLVQSEIDRSTRAAGYSGVLIAADLPAASIIGITSSDVAVALSHPNLSGADKSLLDTVVVSPDYLQSVFLGDTEGTFILPPRHTLSCIDTQGGYQVTSAEDESWMSSTSGVEVVIAQTGEAQARCGIGLGIDAGGTYTDAVIYDLGNGKILAKSKALTTYHDLVEGIKCALVQLPPHMLEMVDVTALSTTLATNSIVEGRGHKVGLLALCPWDWTEEQLGHRPLINVGGAVDITGEIIQPLDELGCRKAITRLVKKEHCAAIVIAGYAANRNPALLNRAREIALEMFDIPVICAHEVSRRINAVQAAQTAVANARLIPIIHDLIDSVRSALHSYSINGRLMVVKGDGTPVDESVARMRPVETILSGPAASVAGARILTGADNALVVDIGGTTTDCAIIEGGRVAECEDGARIGSWVMSVDAVEVSAIGLGGDSRLDFDAERRILVGPARSIPIAYLCHEYPSIKSFLASFDCRCHIASQNASALDVLISSGIPVFDLSNSETKLIQVLANGPIPAVEAATMLDLPSHLLLPIARLEACGAIKRSSLTPTDLLHITGKFTRWDADASRRALEIWASMLGRTADDALSDAFDAFTFKLYREIIRRELSYENKKLHDLPQDWSLLFEKAFRGDKNGLTISFAMNRPVVAIGAPAEALVPAVAKHLNAKIIIPENADVANAIGAIGGEIDLREEILIRPAQPSGYILHDIGERTEFSRIAHATQSAMETAHARALQRATESGANHPRVVITQTDRVSIAAQGQKIFLERVIVARACGSPFSQ